jgi:cytochrome P450
VAWVDQFGGYWIVSKYEDVARVLRDYETFSSTRSSAGGDPGTMAISVPRRPVPYELVPEEFDPPRFQLYRRFMSTVLSPTAVRAMAPRIRRWVTYYIDDVIERGQCDLAEDVAAAVPGAVTLEWLGFPQEDWRRIYTCMHNLTGYTPGAPERRHAESELSFVHARIEELVAERRSRPRADTISYFVAQEVDGQAITDSIAHGMVWLAIAGGVDTTASLTSSVLVHLHRDRDLRARLISDPGIMKTATEEFLRMHAPVRAHARTVVQKTLVNGVVMRPGDRVVAGEVSACHDEDAFEDAGRFDAERFPNRHAAFGFGIHRCPGSHLARAEFTEMITQILERMPDYSIVEEGLAEYPFGLSGIGGWARIPAVFTPGNRRRLSRPDEGSCS